MSAICFSTKVEKEQDDQGTWVKITMRGKWSVDTCFNMASAVNADQDFHRLPYTRF